MGKEKLKAVYPKNVNEVRLYIKDVELEEHLKVISGIFPQFKIQSIQLVSKRSQPKQELQESLL